jgi:glycosyltransferase involved in cell wall biosynthesis
MSRVIFLNRYFFPDHSATSQVLSDVAFALASAGRDVHVICSRQSYDDPRIQLPAEEIIGGVKVHRVRTTHFGRLRLLARSIDYLSFYVSARRALSALARANDLIIAKTDPPLLSLAVLGVTRQRGARLVNWLQDLYPEIAIAAGIWWLKGPLGRSLLQLRDQSLKAAAMNVVVGHGMAQRLKARGIPKGSIRLIANFAADDQISPIARADNPLRTEWGLVEKFVVGYSGNLGRVHEFTTILNAAQQLKDDKRILFLCVGGGKMFEELKRAASGHGLQSKFIFRPYQDRVSLKFSLAAADVHWISLRPEFEGLVVPSKIYGIAAAGRPIIAIALRDGEIGRLIKDHDCGLVFEPGEWNALASTLADLASNPTRCSAMGARARTMLQLGMTKAHATRLWCELVRELGNT